MANPTYKQGMFCWNELGTTDDDAAVNFYKAFLGWTVESNPMPGDMEGTYHIANVNGENVAGMYKMTGPMFEGVPSNWACYVWVQDVDAVWNRVNELGGTTQAPPMDVPGVGRVAFATDPTGASFGLFQAGDHPGAARFEGQAPQGTFCWNECITRDVAAAKTFYTNLFGWTVNDQQMGNTSYTMFMVDDCPAAGLMEMPSDMGETPPHWLAYITVDDCDAKAREVEKLGGKLLVPPTEVPTVGRFCVVQDPTGGVVSVIKLEPKQG